MVFKMYSGDLHFPKSLGFLILESYHLTLPSLDNVHHFLIHIDCIHLFTYLFKHLIEKPGLNSCMTFNNMLHLPSSSCSSGNFGVSGKGATHSLLVYWTSKLHMSSGRGASEFPRLWSWWRNWGKSLESGIWEWPVTHCDSTCKGKNPQNANKTAYKTNERRESPTGCCNKAWFRIYWLHSKAIGLGTSRSLIGLPLLTPPHSTQMNIRAKLQ